MKWIMAACPICACTFLSDPLWNFCGIGSLSRSWIISSHLWHFPTFWHAFLYSIDLTLALWGLLIYLPPFFRVSAESCAQRQHCSWCDSHQCQWYSLAFRCLYKSLDTCVGKIYFELPVQLDPQMLLFRHSLFPWAYFDHSSIQKKITASNLSWRLDFAGFYPACSRHIGLSHSTSDCSPFLHLVGRHLLLSKLKNFYFDRV